MVNAEVELVNRLGLHARAASVFVKKAGEFAAKIEVKKQDRQANGKSIMSMLLLEAAIGTSLTITADGEDEDAALAALVALIEDRFGEDE